MPNSFDDIEIRINELYNNIILEKKINHVGSLAIINTIRMYFMGGLVKAGIYQRLIYGNFILGWFEEFKKFWIKYLLGRPLDVIDYHYLRLHYRSKFQNIRHSDESDKEKFLETWQKQENLHMLLSHLWHYAKKAYLSFYPFLKYLPKNGRILEYGCGIAPITKGLLTYQSHRKYEFIIADIIQINFLYAIYSVSKFKNVKHVVLDPYKNCINKPGYYDAITCLTVFEHLPNPQEVAEDFYRSLKPGGVLIFDFIKGDGGGLDTQKAVKDRGAVLEFIEKKFRIIHGKIKIDKSMGLTVVKKY